MHEYICGGHASHFRPMSPERKMTHGFNMSLQGKCQQMELKLKLQIYPLWDCPPSLPLAVIACAIKSVELDFCVFAVLKFKSAKLLLSFAPFWLFCTATSPDPSKAHEQTSFYCKVSSEQIEVDVYIHISWFVEAEALQAIWEIVLPCTSSGRRLRGTPCYLEKQNRALI